MTDMGSVVMKYDILLALAERCKQSRDGCREMDMAIAEVMGWKSEFGPNEIAPPYTRSLDVAMQLIGEDWEWCMSNTGSDTFGPFCVSLGDPQTFRDVEARTLPLAICAAALLALARDEA